jgi:hypothetical protein
MIYIDAYNHREVKQHIILDKGNILKKIKTFYIIIKEQKEMLGKNMELIKSAENNNIEESTFRF